MLLPLARHAVLVLTAVLLTLASGCTTPTRAERQVYSRGGFIVPDYSAVGFDDVDLADDDIEYLSKALRQIRPWHLYLHGTSITDRSLDHLARIRGMRGLFMGGTQITPAGLDRLLRRAPDTLHQVGVPDAWLNDPAWASEVKALERRYPEFDISYEYRDANGRWTFRKGEGSDRGVTQPAAACGGV